MPSQFQVWFLPLLILAVTTALAIPFSRYLAWIMEGKYRAPRWLQWIEHRVDTGPQNWKQYAISMLLFNLLMFFFGFLVLCLQPCRNAAQPGRQGHAGAHHDFQLRDFVPHQYQFATLLRGAAPLLFQPDLLRHLEHVPFGERGFLRPGGHYPRPAQRPAHGQLLSGHVAGLRPTRSCPPASSWACCCWPTAFP